MDDGGLLSTEEAATILGKSRWTVARMVRRGQLEPVITIGTRYVFRLEDVVKISGVERHGAQGEPATASGVAAHETALPPNTPKAKP